MTDTAARCPNCVGSTGLHLALLQFNGQLACTRCAFRQPIPATGRIVVPSPVVYEQQGQTRMLKEEVPA
jgi:hypothetical protein